MAVFLFFKRSLFWRTDWFTGLLAVAAVIALHVTTDVIGTLERRFYDVASTTTSRLPSDQIAVIAIDDQSIANIGRWPWSREVHARLIDQLWAVKARSIVHTVFFFEPQVDRGLSLIRKMKDALGAADGAPGVTATTREPLTRLIAEAELALDADRQLADSFGNATNVVIASSFTLGEPRGKFATALPAYALNSVLGESSGFSVAAIRGQQPLEVLGAAAAGVGHLNQFQDRDGIVRREPLLVNYDGKVVPSLALLAAAKSLHLAPADIKRTAGESVQLGKLRIKTDKVALMLPQFYPERDGKPAFALDSFDDVRTGKISADRYADKIVVIGVTAAGLGPHFAVPGNPALSVAEIIAHETSSILSEHFMVQPGWGLWATWAVLLLVCGYVVAVLPRATARVATTVTGLLLAALMALEFGLLSVMALWLKLVFPATVLLIGYLALTTKRFLMTAGGAAKSDEESAQTHRMMGLALQGQGQLDMAFERFRQVPMDDAVMGNWLSLALEYERKHQFNKAELVYEQMAAYDKNYKGLKTKEKPALSLSHTALLGRYQVEKELGKGAMGVVYRGMDPKIGRVVAIKTMALSEEFEGAALVDARKLFFREAETAGRLQHQNIVTIFDAGEEHGLAYIAMEFLKGRDLSDFCKAGHLLAVPTVLSIVARVAEALAYAHRQHVVHRDIKPANIMFDIESDTVKVTDFGIARITDSNKTKTGLVLGTPSFMSPEQLAGKKVDGRSDLYSLGVSNPASICSCNRE